MGCSRIREINHDTVTEISYPLPTASLHPTHAFPTKYPPIIDQCFVSLFVYLKPFLCRMTSRLSRYPQTSPHTPHIIAHQQTLERSPSAHSSPHIVITHHHASSHIIYSKDMWRVLSTAVGTDTKRITTTLHYAYTANTPAHTPTADAQYPIPQYLRLTTDSGFRTTPLR